jgi:hypothetical protein
LFILSTGETKKDIHAQRELVVRKMRNGAAGLAVPFWAVPRDVTIKQEVVDADGVVSVLDLTETTPSGGGMRCDPPRASRRVRTIP